jgi:transposase
MAHEVMTQLPDNGRAVDTPPPPLPPTPPSEVVARPQRRSFTTAFKQRILAEADRCTQHGQLGALLRREGLYSSHLVDWRHQREQGQLGQAQRGRPAAAPTAKQVAALGRENTYLRRRLAQAEGIIAVQEEVASLLGDDCETTLPDAPR